MQMNLLVVFVVDVLVVVFLLSFEQFGHELLLLLEQLRRHAKRVLRRSFELFAKIVVVVSIFTTTHYINEAVQRIHPVGDDCIHNRPRFGVIFDSLRLSSRVDERFDRLAQLFFRHLSIARKVYRD